MRVLLVKEGGWVGSKDIVGVVGAEMLWLKLTKRLIMQQRRGCCSGFGENTFGGGERKTS